LILGLIGKSAQLKYRGNSYRGKAGALDFPRDVDANASDGFKLRVFFVASDNNPANMPVTIDIQE